MNYIIRVTEIRNGTKFSPKYVNEDNWRSDNPQIFECYEDAEEQKLDLEKLVALKKLNTSGTTYKFEILPSDSVWLGESKNLLESEEAGYLDMDKALDKLTQFEELAIANYQTTKAYNAFDYKLEEFDNDNITCSEMLSAMDAFLTAVRGEKETSEFAEMVQLTRDFALYADLNYQDIITHPEAMPELSDTEKKKYIRHLAKMDWDTGHPADPDDFRRFRRESAEEGFIATPEDFAYYWDCFREIRSKHFTEATKTSKEGCKKHILSEVKDINKVKVGGTAYLKKLGKMCGNLMYDISENQYDDDIDAAMENDTMACFYFAMSDLLHQYSNIVDTNHEGCTKFYKQAFWKWFNDPWAELDEGPVHPDFKDAMDTCSVWEFCKEKVKEVPDRELASKLEDVLNAASDTFNNAKWMQKLNIQFDNSKDDEDETSTEPTGEFNKNTLKDIAKRIKIKIDSVSFTDVANWHVELDTEDEDVANDFRNAVGDVLDGTENAYGASYDDIPGMGDIHLGCVQVYEWEEMCGGDSYEDLDEDYRDKYIVFACPKKKWIAYRRMTDY